MAGTRAYLGIPYATAGRFERPVPAAPVDLERCTRVGPAAPQRPGMQRVPGSPVGPIDDAGMMLRHRIGVDHVLVESDYPHADSSWPNTQAMLVRQLEAQGVPDDEAELITWTNASTLFRHPDG